MIKPFKKSEYLLKLQSLTNRLPEHHPKFEKLKIELYRQLRCYYGESNALFHLKELPDVGQIILHDIKLGMNNHTFQIDFLLLTHKYAIIFECKNFSNNVTFKEDLNQFTRKNAEDQDEGYTDPISQAKRQRFLLQKWLNRYSFPQIPIEILVVITDPSTLVNIDSTYQEAKNHVLYCHGILEKFINIHDRFTKEILSTKMLHTIGGKMKTEHIHENTNILSKNNIKANELILGVRCELCNKYYMQYKQGKWRCLKCTHTSNTAHIKAMEEYFHLFGPAVTNKKCRQFLMIESADAARRLLLKMNFTTTGSYRGKIYTRN